MVDIIGPFRIRDNGVRTFVPPCYCFELIDRHGEVLATVSSVDRSKISGSSMDAHAFVQDHREDLFEGYMSGYAVDNSPDTGVAIVLTNSVSNNY